MLHTPTSQPLFIQHKSAAELLSKEAAAIARMPDDDKRWPAQVLSEIHKQLPFMSKYDVDIEMTRVEPEAGYALGYAILRNKTGRQRAEEQLGKPTNKLRVPVIVADRMLQPFHVFEIGGKVYPLTQDRVESAMMNPAMFDGAADPPGTRSLLDQIYPPFQHRQGYGMMSGDRSTQGVSKLSSAPSTNKVATVALAIPLTSDNDRSTQQLRYAHEDLKDRKPRHLLNALVGGASGATFGGLAGHAIADHAAFSGGKSLMTTGRGAALGAALGAAALPAGIAAYRKHRLSELDRQIALRGRVDSSASKSASGELGPLREFLREAVIEKQAANLGQQMAKSIGQKFVSGVERKGAQALVGAVKPPTLPHAPPPGNAGGFMPRSATTSAAMHAPAPAARPAAAPPVAPRPAAPAPTPTAAPAKAPPPHPGPAAQPVASNSQMAEAYGGHYVAPPAPGADMGARIQQRAAQPAAAPVAGTQPQKSFHEHLDPAHQEYLKREFPTGEHLDPTSIHGRGMQRQGDKLYQEIKSSGGQFDPSAEYANFDHPRQLRLAAASARQQGDHALAEALDAAHNAPNMGGYERYRAPTTATPAATAQAPAAPTTPAAPVSGGPAVNPTATNVDLAAGMTQEQAAQVAANRGGPVKPVIRQRPASTPAAAPAPAAAAPIPPTAGAPVAPANSAATDVNLAASMTPQQAQAINAGAPQPSGRRTLRDIKAESAARAASPEGVEKRVQQARDEGTRAAESKANAQRIRERMTAAQDAAKNRAAEAAKSAPAGKSQPSFNERAAREQAEAAAKQQQAHQTMMQNPQARRAYLESKGLNPSMTPEQYQTLNSNYEVARQAMPNLTMDQFIAANPNTVGRNVLFGQAGSGLGVGAVPVRPGAAAPAAEAASGGKSLTPYLAGAALLGGGAYMANKATDTVSQY